MSLALVADAGKCRGWLAKISATVAIVYLCRIQIKQFSRSTAAGLNYTTGMVLGQLLQAEDDSRDVGG